MKNQFILHPFEYKQLIIKLRNFSVFPLLGVTWPYVVIALEYDENTQERVKKIIFGYFKGCRVSNMNFKKVVINFEEYKKAKNTIIFVSK